MASAASNFSVLLKAAWSSWLWLCTMWAFLTSLKLISLVRLLLANFSSCSLHFFTYFSREETGLHFFFFGRGASFLCAISFKVSFFFTFSTASFCSISLLALVSALSFFLCAASFLSFFSPVCFFFLWWLFWICSLATASLPERL